MNRNYYRRLVRAVRRLWYRFVTLKSSSENIAAGFALGILIGLLPTFGFQIVLVTALAVALRMNVFSGLVGIQITNYVTFVPIYVFNYKVGCWVLGLLPTAHRVLERTGSMREFIKQLLGAGIERFGILWLGSLIVAVPSTVVSYFGMKALLVYARRFISRRRLVRLQQLMERRTASAAAPAQQSDPPNEPDAGKE